MTRQIPFTTIAGTADVAARLRRLDATQRHAVLATVSGSRPLASLIAFALTPDLRHLVFATPTATTKYRNIVKNSRVSLLVDTRKNTEGDYAAAEAITITGTARPVRKGTQWTVLAGVLSSKHPLLKEFVEAPGTALITVRISRCVHVSRFQVVSVWKA